MTQIEKLILKLAERPTDLDFDEVRRVLEYYGWALSRQRGSHVSFTHSKDGIISFPLKHGRKVTRVYITQIVRQLGLEEGQ